MRKLVFVVLIAMMGAAPAWGQAKPAAASVEVTPPAEKTLEIDNAWKDLQIAQLHLQLVLQQTLAAMDKGTYYSMDQHKFFKPAPPSAPVPTAKESPTPPKKETEKK